MDAPLVRGENRSFRKARGALPFHPSPVDPKDRFPATDSKIFQPCKVENRFSNTLPAEAAACGSGETRQHSNGEPLRLLPREAIDPNAGQDAEHRQMDQTHCTLNLLEAGRLPATSIYK